MTLQDGLTMAVEQKRAVVFDLFDTLTAIERSWANGLPMTSDLLGIDRLAWDRLLHQPERLRGYIRDPFVIIAALARSARPEVTDQEIRRAVHNRVARFEGALLDIPIENVEVLKALRSQGKKIRLISNADMMEVQAWGRSPIQSLFDVCVFSCDVGYVKPEAEIYQTCTDQLGLRPAECAFVGDGASDELRGARKLGLLTIMVTGVIKDLWPERIPDRAKDADYTINELTELIALPA